MNDTLWVSMLIGLVAVAIGWRLLKFDRASTADEKWLPEELKTAELRYAEKTFKIWWPIALVARVDRAYALGTEIRLLEFKTRARSVVYRSDVIELSAQRMAIEISTGAHVSKIGYVLTQDPFGKTRAVHRVRLMRKHELVAAVKRRAGILSGMVEPRYPESIGLCQKCGFREQCWSEVRRGE